MPVQPGLWENLRNPFPQIVPQTLDLGGQETFRMIWEPYVKNAIAIVYVIDSSTPEYFDESALIITEDAETDIKPAVLLYCKSKGVIIDINETTVEDFIVLTR